MPCPPATPTFTTASGGRNASSRAVAAAASTGPTPQIKPSRLQSSMSVAATRRTVIAQSLPARHELEHGMAGSFREPLVLGRGERDVEERMCHAAEPVVLAQHGDGRLRRELADGEPLVSTSPSKLDPPGCTCIPHPVAI